MLCVRISLSSAAARVSSWLIPLEGAAAEWLAPAARAIRPGRDRARSKLLRLAGYRLTVAATLRRERTGTKRPRLGGRAVGPAGDRAAAKLLRMSRDVLAVSAPLRRERARPKRPCLAARAIRPMRDGSRTKLVGRARTWLRHARPRRRGLCGDQQTGRESPKHAGTNHECQTESRWVSHGSVPGGFLKTHAGEV